MTLKILVAVDLSKATKRVIQVTERIARGMSGEAWVLHVAEAEPDLVGFDAGPEVVRDQVAKEFREEHKAVQEYADTLRKADIEATALLIRGPIVDTLAAAGYLSANELDRVFTSRPTYLVTDHEQVPPYFQDALAERFQQLIKKWGRFQLARSRVETYPTRIVGSVNRPTTDSAIPKSSPY